MRESGILMHITSLPGPYGIGTMGVEARKFLDFLQAAGQSCWQILPLNPTGYGNSPYQSCSSYAGNPYLIDLDTLVAEKLLKHREIRSYAWGSRRTWVDFGKLYENRLPLLRKAFRRFTPDGSYQKFVEENQHWLREHCLFMALKEDLGGVSWQQWPQELMLRQSDALESARARLDEDIRFHYFLQYQFDRQWKALHGYARERGIRIIGDVPIYVPLDSADVWMNPELFALDAECRPVEVAGCPPDAFTADGQLWGNPLYNWEKLAATGFTWWTDRLKAAAARYDVIRLDHFRGYESYWAVPAGDDTARNGQWLQGPGQDFIDAIHTALPEQAFIAEDLGYLTDEVRQLQARSGYPGMKVLEFAFDSREQSDYLPHCYGENSVCYTGTHDNATLRQWFQDAAPEDVACARAYLGLNTAEGYVWGMIRGGMGSVSQLFIAQMQDYLELGKFSRMNQPGLLSDANWTWRAKKNFASPKLAAKLRTVTARYGRLPEHLRR